MIEARGRWTDLRDEDRKRWVRVYIEWPEPLMRGSASALPGEPENHIILGPDGRPLSAGGRRRIGFGR